MTRTPRHHRRESAARPAPARHILRPPDPRATSVQQDSAVPPERLGAYLRDFDALLARHGLHGLPYGHFGDGCMHVRIARGVHKVGTVVLVDVNAERLQMSADAVSPDHTIDASKVDVVEEIMRLTGGRGADVVITATPANVPE